MEIPEVDLKEIEDIVSNDELSPQAKCRWKNHAATRCYSIVLIGTIDRLDVPFPVPLHPFKCSTIQTMSFNIYNNIWNTNDTFWYPYNKEDADIKAKFAINFV